MIKYCCLASIGRGTFRASSGTSYSLTYLVIATKDCGPAYIMNNATCLPSPGSIYDPYNKCAPAGQGLWNCENACEHDQFATVDSYDPRIAKKAELDNILKTMHATGCEEVDKIAQLACKNRAWLVDVSFNNQSGNGSNNNNQCEIDQLCPQILPSQLIREVPANDLVFEGYWQAPFVGDCDTATDSTCSDPSLQAIDNCAFKASPGQCVGLPKNSVGDLIADGPTIPIQEMVFSVDDYELNFINVNGFEYIGRTNCDPVRIRVPCRQFNIAFDRHTLRVVGIVPQYRQFNCPGAGGYWAYAWHFHFDPCGHRYDLANVGYRDCQECPDPSGTPQDVVKKIVDRDGDPISDPVLLGADGKKLNGAIEVSSFMRYRHRCYPNPTQNNSLGLPPWLTAV